MSSLLIANQNHINSHNPNGLSALSSNNGSREGNSINQNHDHPGASSDVQQKLLNKQNVHNKQLVKLHWVGSIEAVLTPELMEKIILTTDPQAIPGIQSEFIQALLNAVQVEFGKVLTPSELKSTIESLFMEYREQLTEAEKEKAYAHWKLIDKYFPNFSQKTDEERSKWWFGDDIHRELVLVETKKEEKKIYQTLHQKFASNIYEKLSEKAEKKPKTNLDFKEASSTIVQDNKNKPKPRAKPNSPSGKVKPSKQPVAKKDPQTLPSAQHTKDSKAEITQKPGISSMQAISDEEAKRMIEDFSLQMDRVQDQVIYLTGDEYYDKQNELEMEVRNRIPQELINKILGPEIDFIMERANTLTEEEIVHHILEQIRSNQPKRHLLFVLSSSMYATLYDKETIHWKIAVGSFVKNHFNQARLNGYNQILKKYGLFEQPVENLSPAPSFQQIWPQLKSLKADYDQKIARATTTAEIAQLKEELRRATLDKLKLPESHQTKFAFHYESLIKKEPYEFERYNSVITQFTADFIEQQAGQELPSDIRKIVNSLKQDLDAGKTNRLTQSIENTKSIHDKLSYLANYYQGEKENDALNCASFGVHFVYSWLTGDEKERAEMLKPHPEHLEAIEFTQNMISRSVMSPRPFLVSYHPDWSTHVGFYIPGYKKPIEWINMRPTNNHFLGAPAAVHEIAHGSEYHPTVIQVTRYLQRKHFEFDQKAGQYVVPSRLRDKGWYDYMGTTYLENNHVSGTELVSSFLGDFCKDPWSLLKDPESQEMTCDLINALRGIEPEDPQYKELSKSEYEHHAHSHDDHNHHGHSHGH